MGVFCYSRCPVCKKTLRAVISNDGYFYKGSIRVITHEGGYCPKCKLMVFNKRKLEADEMLLDMFCERVDEREMVKPVDEEPTK